MANDKGSRVRRALLEILKSRRAAEHLEALVILAGDKWSPQIGYYGQEADNPIALGAAEILGEPPPLPESVLDRLIETSTETNDSDVRQELLTAIVRNGGTTGLEKVCELALSRENLRLSIAANWALYRASEKVDEATAARITIEQLTTRSALAAVPMALVIGGRGSESQLLKTAKSLSTNSKRKALLLPLAIMASSRDAALAEGILNLLPANRIEVIRAALTNGRKMPRDVVDDLGDVRLVEELMRRFDSLFVPKKK